MTSSTQQRRRHAAPRQHKLEPKIQKVETFWIGEKKLLVETWGLLCKLVNWIPLRSQQHKWRRTFWTPSSNASIWMPSSVPNKHYLGVPESKIELLSYSIIPCTQYSGEVSACCYHSNLFKVGWADVPTNISRSAVSPAVSQLTERTINRRQLRTF